MGREWNEWQDKAWRKQCKHQEGAGTEVPLCAFGFIKCFFFLWKYCKTECVCTDTSILLLKWKVCRIVANLPRKAGRIRDFRLHCSRKSRFFQGQGKIPGLSRVLKMHFLNSRVYQGLQGAVLTMHNFPFVIRSHNAHLFYLCYNEQNAEKKKIQRLCILKILHHTFFFYKACSLLWWKYTCYALNTSEMMTSRTRLQNMTRYTTIQYEQPTQHLYTKVVY